MTKLSLPPIIDLRKTLKEATLLAHGARPSFHQTDRRAGWRIVRVRRIKALSMPRKTLALWLCLLAIG